LTAENTSKPESEPPLVELPPVITTSIDQTLRTSSIPYPLPQPATAKIFAPRTEDMNKGFLMFSDDEPGLTSKFYNFHLYIYIDLYINIMCYF
jgi:hypoxia-inducible factor 1 alpha